MFKILPFLIGGFILLFTIAYIGFTVRPLFYPKPEVVVDNTVKEVKTLYVAKTFAGVVLSGKYVKGNLVDGKDVYNLAEKSSIVGNIYVQDHRLGMVKIDRSKLTEHQNIFLDFYKSKKMVTGIIENRDGDNIRLINDPTKTTYFINKRLPFSYINPSKLYWSKINHPELLDKGDAIRLTLKGYVYVAPLLGSTTGIVRVLRTSEQAVEIEISSDDLKILINTDTTILDKNKKPLKIELSRFPTDLSRVYILYYVNDQILIAKSITIL
ncbi:hypothetical protein HZB69_02825 [Candidatus Amesbacteria bacterium]|nr:hypothetical protein [Candidatus Amesbacteria bacterium]